MTVVNKSKFRVKVGISISIVLMLITSSFFVLITIIPDQTKASLGSSYYPAKIDIKVGKLPGQLSDEIMRGFLVLLPFPGYFDWYHPSYEKYETFGSYLDAQLQQIDWRDSANWQKSWHKSTRRIFVKVDITNSLPSDINDVSATIQLDYDNQKLTPLGYQFDSSFEPSISDHSSVTWSIPHMNAGETKTSFFLSTDFETDGIFLSAREHPFNFINIGSNSNSYIDAKITQANGYIYKSSDYSIAPHLTDDVKIPYSSSNLDILVDKFIQPGSIGDITPMDPIFNSPSVEYPNEAKHLSLNTGEKITVGINILNPKGCEYVFTGPPGYGCDSIWIRDYVPPWIKVTKTGPMYLTSQGTTVQLPEFLYDCWEEDNTESCKDKTISCRYKYGLCPSEYLTLYYEGEITGEGSSSFLLAGAGAVSMIKIGSDLPGIASDIPTISGFDWVGMNCFIPPPAELSFSPKSLDFNDMYEDETGTNEFQVSNIGGGTLDYSIACEESWIDVSPTSGSSTDSEDVTTHIVTINTKGLSIGEHTGSIYIESELIEVSVNIVETPPENSPPAKPSTHSGPTPKKVDTSYTYSTSTTDPDSDQISYLFDWGDDTDSGWLGPYESGATCEGSHKWDAEGNYKIKVKAKDINGLESEWSEAFSITISKNKVFNRPLLSFLQQHSILYQLFELLQRLFKS